MYVLMVYFDKDVRYQPSAILLRYFVKDIPPAQICPAYYLNQEYDTRNYWTNETPRKGSG